MRANKNNKTTFAKKFVGGVAIALAVTLFFVLLTAAGLVIYINSDTDVDVNAIALKNSLPEVYDVNGDLTSYCAASEIQTDGDNIPDDLKNAFVALEDKRFYDHHGVDYKRILGAFVANIKSGRRAQGGSTITQQIVKNAFLSNEKSFSRKLKEARLAVSLERRMTKDDILETYLNMLYFGSGEYGVKNACRRFFAKEVKDLSLAECAVLAGIVKSPTKYNPINNPENSFKRAKLVLSLMKEQGLITDSEYNAAINEKVAIADDKSALDFDRTYVVNALSEACDILGIDEKELRAQGYKLYTYLDTERQTMLKTIIDDKAYSIDEKAWFAAIDCDTKTGGVRALSSDFDADFNEFRRQAGSVLKPLVCYAPAFESGVLTPASMLDDKPTDFNGYSPGNFGEKYYGKISVRDALAYSQNIPAVAALRQIGVQNGYNALVNMGFKLSESDDILSLALGSTARGVTFTEILSGYMTLANGGVYKKATFIKYIEDKDGHTVYNKNDEKGIKRVFSEETAYMTTSALISTARYGTAKKLSSLDFEIASKTGTVEAGNGNADAYNVSYTTDDCVLFWQGSQRYDEPISSKITGGGLPTLACKDYLSAVVGGGIPANFAVPEGISEINIDKIAYEKDGSVIAASDNAPERFTVKEIFPYFNMPEEKDSSFDYPSAKGLEASVDGNKVTIRFTADPHLNYKVIKKSLFTDDKIILNIENDDGEITVTDTADGILGYNRYVVVPYYTDDLGRETIGEIYTVPIGW